MTTILVNHNGTSQLAAIVHIFPEYIKVLFGDGSKAYLARTADKRGTSAPDVYRTATQSQAAHAMLCNLDKAAREREAEARAAVTVASGISLLDTAYHR
jgi:hypothetical protein